MNTTPKLYMVQARDYDHDHYNKAFNPLLCNSNAYSKEELNAVILRHLEYNAKKHKELTNSSRCSFDYDVIEASALKWVSSFNSEKYNVLQYEDVCEEIEDYEARRAAR